jgi:hypothetical protein
LSKVKSIPRLISYGRLAVVVFGAITANILKGAFASTLSKSFFVYKVGFVMGFANRVTDFTR